MASLTQAEAPELDVSSHDLHCLGAALQSLTSFSSTFMHLKFFVCVHTDVSVSKERDQCIVKAVIIFVNSRHLKIYRH
jgi:hypothetical protein